MKTTPTSHQTKTKPLTMFALALMYQLLMPFTLSLAALVMDSQSIVFCTPLALTTVSINADTGDKLPQNAIPKACEFCQICELNTGGVGISKTTVTYSFTALTPFFLKLEHFSTPLKQEIFSRPFPARAPPGLT